MSLPLTKEETLKGFDKVIKVINTTFEEKHFIALASIVQILHINLYNLKMYANAEHLFNEFNARKHAIKVTENLRRSLNVRTIKKRAKRRRGIHK